MISFFIFLAGLIYLKVPQKINGSLINQINEIKKELDEAEKLKVEAKNLLSDYESKIDKSKKEIKDIINSAKKYSEKTILENLKFSHGNLSDEDVKNAAHKTGADRFIRKLEKNSYHLFLYRNFRHFLQKLSNFLLCLDLL